MFFSVFLTYGYSICNGYSVFALTRRLAFPFLAVRRYMVVCHNAFATIYRYAAPAGPNAGHIQLLFKLQLARIQLISRPHAGIIDPIYA